MQFLLQFTTHKTYHFFDDPRFHSNRHFRSSYDDEDDESLYSGSDDREDTEKTNSSLIKSFGTPKSDASSPSPRKRKGAAAADASNNVSVTSTASSEAGVNPSSELIEFQPLTLVWAKCRGYPWYPALIIDPTIPKGYVYNGVPLPTPPRDVIELRKDKVEPVYLVLFFDAKRTWQWLPPNKLEKLGVNSKLDNSKLTESRKQSKAVKKAYDDALHYNSQVSDITGQGPGAIA